MSGGVEAEMRAALIAIGRVVLATLTTLDRPGVRYRATIIVERDDRETQTTSANVLTAPAENDRESVLETLQHAAASLGARPAGSWGVNIDEDGSETTEAEGAPRARRHDA